MYLQPRCIVFLISLSLYVCVCVPGQIPDYASPVVVPRRRRTVEDFCNRIHKSLIKDFKFARVWGSSVKHNPQRVGKDHMLEDEDVVQIVKHHN